MKSIMFLFICFLFSNCSSPNENQVINGFPEKSLSSGTDEDYSFQSLITQRQKDGTLKAQITGWGFEEFGLLLEVQKENKTLNLNIMGRCGTVSTYTNVKKTFEYIVSRAEEDSLTQIQYNTFVITK